MPEVSPDATAETASVAVEAALVTPPTACENVITADANVSAPVPKV
jgi:hypothetical protein